MTSEERREGRYRRRKAARMEKRRKAQEGHGYADVINRDALAKAAKDAARGVMYKASTQRFMARRITNVAELNKKLERRRDVRKGFICFTLSERGKSRDIMSVRFSERVVQKSLNKNALVPVLTRSLIYDNGASQKGKGTKFAMDRTVVLLRRYYGRYGSEGYVLKLDFKDYFANIDHGIVKQIVRDAFDDEDIVWLAGLFVDACYDHAVREAKRSGGDPGDVKRKGLGLGSETNQTFAVAYTNRLDHYIKEVLRIRCYVRYMDDAFLVHPDKRYLARCLAAIREVCEEMKIGINEKKTGITKLSRGFKFLQTQISLTETGRILRRPCREAIVRERRRLKRQKSLVDAGIMTVKEAQRSYASWRGGMKRKQARKSVRNMDNLYNNFFINDFLEGGYYHARNG